LDEEERNPIYYFIPNDSLNAYYARFQGHGSGQYSRAHVEDDRQISDNECKKGKQSGGERRERAIKGDIELSSAAFRRILTSNGVALQRRKNYEWQRRRATSQMSNAIAGVLNVDETRFAD
jgi:hypothetical protein